MKKKANNMSVSIEKRPCLIVGYGRGFLIEKNSNYSGLKITTRYSNIKLVNRVKIENWKQLGLKKKSYVRIELPLKIEDQQLISKIGTLPSEEIALYLKELACFFNTDVLNKISQTISSKHAVFFFVKLILLFKIYVIINNRS